MSNKKHLTLEAARALGIEKWIEKMLNFAEQLRRLRLDSYEYVSMKVIVLLTSGLSSMYASTFIELFRDFRVGSLKYIFVAL